MEIILVKINSFSSYYYKKIINYKVSKISETYYLYILKLKNIVENAVLSAFQSNFSIDV